MPIPQEAGIKPKGFLPESTANLMDPNFGREGLPSLTPDTLKTKERIAPGINVIINGQGGGAAKLVDIAIARGHNVVGIVTTTKIDDKGKPDPLRAKAIELGITIVNLGDVNSSLRKPDDKRFIEANQKLRDMNADLAVGFFLQAPLSKETYAIPEYGTINYHPSKLPKRRGRDSMKRAIMDGDSDIWLSAYLMNGRVDAGPIVRQTSYKNPGDKSQASLYFDHLDDAVNLMADALDDMAEGIDRRRRLGKKEKLHLVVQNEDEATVEPPLSDEEMRLDLSKVDGVKAKNMVLTGDAWFLHQNGETKVRLSKPRALDIDHDKPGAYMMKDKKVVFFAAKGALEIDEVKIGRVKFPAHEYFLSNNVVTSIEEAKAS